MKRFILLIFFYSCQSFDITSSSEGVGFTQPKIEQLILNGNNLSIQISINLVPNNRDDFNNYAIFAVRTSDNFSSLYSRNLNEITLTSPSGLPFHVTNTTRPNFSGNLVDDITHTINLDNDLFTIGESYRLTVLAWGVNSDLGFAFNNNGWVYSPFSEERVFNYRRERLGITLSQFALNDVDLNYGFNLIDGEIVLNSSDVTSTDVTGSTNQVAYYLEQTTTSSGALFDTPNFFIGNGSAIQPLGSSFSLGQVLELPETGFLSSGNSLPINPNNLYLVRNSNNTYMKIYVNSINILSQTNIINLDVAYSTVTNIKFF